MDAYIFQAALHCEDCGEQIKRDLSKGDTPMTESEDSDVFPFGPVPNGGGEADSPQHCDSCGQFLDNPLTGDGETYVRDAFLEFVDNGRGDINVLAEWKNAYDWVWDQFVEITFADMTDDGNVSDLQQRRFDDLEAT